MTRLLTICLLTLGFGHSVSAADWQPADGPLMTRWAKDVSPDNVWPEYPRPQMVRDDWVNLNGLWDYAIQDKEADRPTNWDGQILVPFAAESALSGVMKPVKPEQRLWYRRTFGCPDVQASERVLLHFGAVDWDTTIWINGAQVGTHRGGYEPFALDITEQLKQDDNELVLAVWDPTDAGYQPRGKQVLKPGGIMYTAVTGIWQTVWLETVPAAYIQSLKIVPDIDRGVVSVTVNTSVAASVRLSALDGKRVVATKTGPAGKAIELKIDNAKLWSPDAPNLYDLKVELIQKDKAVDAVASYFGMRKTHVAKDADGVNRLMLNNEVLFQYGPLDQGWWPDGLYTPASDEAMKYDIVMTKKFGMNMARKHVKYEGARWYYWCDKLGLLVWQDMPAGDSPRNDESKANFRRELKGMIDTLHNFPCIVMWVPFNEGWGQYDTPEVVEWTQQYDPTRPVNEASGWHDRGSGDVSDMHNYPGPGMRPVEDDRVVVLGEFGGLGMPVAGHTWQAAKNWGYVSFESAEELTDAYVDLMTQMRPLIGQGLSAAVYTQTSDVEVEVNGLLTYDRDVVKMNLKRIAEAANKLYLPPPIIKTLVPTSQQQPQTWKYTFEQPSGVWFEPEFDDAGWKSGPGGFGTEDTPGTSVKTIWNTSDIWVRRTFQLGELPSTGDISLTIHHDEDAEVYLNGQLVRTLGHFTSSYKSLPLSAKAVKALRTGQNVIAIHCRQTEGGQYIDAGLSLLVERE
ncbi:MAG TPA: glycoside hydrolase family 2 TIM barrel-domain containing protein [Thermoguttaceae bacterium]|nr:glycoside hydrolase family 2 TIM barrel-domain containing protein [Thermoguttaceae bacterium]